MHVYTKYVRVLIALLFIAFGIWCLVSPKTAFAFKASIAKNVGVKMTASPKTYKAVKYVGLALAIIGFLLYLG